MTTLLALHTGTNLEGSEAWTWRAPRSLEGRGSVDSALLPPNVRGGRRIAQAEAEIQMDGIFVTAVQPPKPSRGFKR